ncbi:hypothetical protein [Enterococcus entomosocium]|jgi:hypothetical protein|uniref:Transcriptional regulator n=1 Tax=Enterococcus entomosocium TaxID=3034352 RepID=A0ABV3MDT6_9ENTE|nr:hypothetical protein [Bacillales bacterium]
MKNKQAEERIIEIMDEIVVLSKEYELLKNQKFTYNRDFSQERIHEEYVKESENKKYNNSYDIISLYVASFLKLRGVPTKSQIIYNYLVEEKQVSLSYSNFQSNYLKKIHDDNKINVDRAHRGYYQYRRKSN